MGSDLNLPKSLTQLSSPPPPQRLEEQSERTNMPMLYYGLVVVATAAIVLAIYNLLIVRWCANQYRRRSSHEQAANEVVFRNPTIGLTTTSTSSFRYKKGSILEEEDTKKLGVGELEECSVCLSVFEEGEQVKKLGRCNHWFHGACIDMWLYSHSDCPLCRTPVVDHSDNSRDGLLLLDTSSSSV